MGIFFFILFCVLNARLARKKGLTQGKWIWRTIAAMFGGIFLGSLMVAVSYKGPADMVSLEKYLSVNPLKEITIFMLMIGGGLLVRYILEKKPDATSQE